VTLEHDKVKTAKTTTVQADASSSSLPQAAVAAAEND